MQIQLEEGSFGLPVVPGAQTSPDVRLGVRAQPGEPVLDQVPDLIPEDSRDAVDELGVALPVPGRGRVSSLNRREDVDADHHTRSTDPKARRSADRRSTSSTR